MKIPIMRLAVAACILCLPLGAFAANTTSLRHSNVDLQAVQQQIQTEGLVQENVVTGAPSAQVAVAVSRALNLSSDEKLDLVSSQFNNQTNLREIKYQQVYKGVPLLYNRIMLSRERNGTVKWMHGDAVTNIGQDLKSVQASFGPGEALNIAKSSNASLRGFAAASVLYKRHSIKLAIWLDDNQTAHLVYQVEYIVYPPNNQPPARPLYIIDAHTGQVLDHWNNMQTAQQIGTGPGGNAKAGRRTYGQTRPKLLITQRGSQCLLQGTHVTVLNLNGLGHNSSGGSQISFNCPNNPGIALNGAYGIDNDALFDGMKIIDLYRQWYNTPALPITLVMRVNTPWANAQWNGRNMTFGNGGSRFYPLSSGLNVGGHEVSHGFTAYHSGLIYQGPSGGLNEAFSDMAGETLEYFVKGSVDWYVGGAVDKQGRGLRYMVNQSIDGRSIINANNYRAGMDPHFVSGVFNRAFYLLTTEWNGNLKKSFRVFVVANESYWSSRVSFQSAGQGAVDAAEALGYNGCDVSQAMSQVGIQTTHGTCGGNPPPSSGNPPPSSGNPPPSSGNPPPSSGTGSCQGVPAWNASTVYTGGDQVRYNGNLYTANWWTQGANPAQNSGQWDVWTLDGSCSGGNPPPSSGNPPPSSGNPPPSSGNPPPSSGNPPPSSGNPPPSSGTGNCPIWAVGTTYQAGDVVSYQGENYTAAISHTAYSSTWDPVDAPALWNPGGSCQ